MWKGEGELLRVITLCEFCYCDSILFFRNKVTPPAVSYWLRKCCFCMDFLTVKLSKPNRITNMPFVRE